MMTQRKLILALMFGLLLSWQAVFAEDGEWRQVANAAILPKYCQDRLDKDGRWQKWRDYFGDAFIHMHHYCGGIYGEFKARSAIDKQKRNYWIGVTESEMRYVAPYCDPKCVIYADLHKRWAWALMQQGKLAEAMTHSQLSANAGQVRPVQAPASAPSN